MCRTAVLFAQQDLMRDLEQRLQVWGYTILTVLAIGLLVWAVFKVREKLMSGEDPEISPEELLTRYHILKQSGELSDEEYRRIARRIQKGEKSPPAAGDSTPPPETSP